MTTRRALFLVSAAILLLPAGVVLAAEHEETIATRGDVTLSFVITAPDAAPTAAAILFAGGNGKLKLWQGKGARNRDFLVRSRQLFADRGVLTVTVDVASDQRESGLNDIRDGTDHRTDIAALVKWIRQKTSVPLWLIGTSRGTVSVAYLASTLPVDGAVFTASVTEASGKRSANVYDADLDRIKIPSLIVHHKRDECSVTPAYAVPGFAAKLENAEKVGILLFDGGDDPISRSCGAQSAHGFLGIESKVVGDIVSWMKANRRP
jgi:pimeloyl-ACP methyl ester carboxylesterase